MYIGDTKHLCACWNIRVQNWNPCDPELKNKRVLKMDGIGSSEIEFSYFLIILLICCGKVFFFALSDLSEPLCFLFHNKPNVTFSMSIKTKLIMQNYYFHSFADRGQHYSIWYVTYLSRGSEINSVSESSSFTSKRPVMNNIFSAD